LESLGVTEVEERLYFEALRRGRAQAAEISRQTGVGPAVVRRGLARLEELGLLNRLPGRRGLLPVTPDLAVQSLLALRQDALHAEQLRLEATRRQAADLIARLGPGSAGSADTAVEVVTGLPQVHHWFVHLQRSAREEVRIFDKPPYASAVAQVNELELELLRGGVHYRCLYDRRSLEQPHQLRAIETAAAAGEQARVADRLPMKLAMSDQQLAIVPLDITEQRIEGVLVIRASSLLAPLADLFELLWARSTSLSGERTVDRVNSADRRLLELLASGLKDETIARQLDLSMRTLSRRVTDLLSALGATTRFQAGLEAVRRGWL